MKASLMDFPVSYILYRRHGGVRKELNVKTTFQATKKWFEIKPEFFLENPDVFKNKIITCYNSSFLKQLCET